MFTIYSIGDSAFLAQILNSLAMITGTGDFEQLVAIGLVLGLFIMGVQCVMSGTRQFNLHQVFLGFLCYLCMFGPSVTVHIEDAYTGQVRTVDNVPVGAGVAGTLISNVGYGVTQLFEQGYGDVDRMTEHSFGDALKSLNSVRAIAYDASILNAASQSLGAGSDLRKSLDNYIRECTMVKIVVGQGTPEEVYGGGLNALAFQNTIYGTEVYLPGNNAAKLDCSAAWQQLKPRFEQAMLGLEKGDSREYVGRNTGQFGRFLREAWRELAGKEVEFPAQLLDVGLEDFFLYGESAAALQVVCRRKQGHGSVTAKASALDEAELVKLVDDEGQQERLAAEGVGHRLVVKIECTSVETGNQLSKHLVFELRGDDVGHDDK